MKVNIKEHHKRFQPITIELVIESKDDFRDLFARFDCLKGGFKDSYKHKEYILNYYKNIAVQLKKYGEDKDII